MTILNVDTTIAPLRSGGDIMDWRTLQSDRDLPVFVDAAVELHRPLFERLSSAERPFFNDYWLRRFNEARAYLHANGSEAMVLVTVPRSPDLHPFRWGIRTLAYREEIRGAIVLPDGVGLERAFTLPSPTGTVPAAPIIAGTTHEPVQLSYVRSLADIDPVSPHETAPLEFRTARSDDLEPILHLLERAYADFDDVDPELFPQREEVRQIIEHGAGWCFVAVAPDDPAQLVAMASYVLHPLQLVGVPVILVADLAVDPNQRRRGLARNLQRFAYACMRGAGYRWVYGNIDPGNLASRGQAEAVGREVWFQAVRFREEGPEE
ncbi:MAG: GNAT family N-acetyltransferase [Planctomycetota bacterium]|nr:GNAT family N-acetyltransferase [Planctomycetota bacterium]